MDCALVLLKRGRPVSAIARTLRLARSHLVELKHRLEQWKDMRFKANRRADKNQDQQLLTKLKAHLERFPSFGYRRLTALENRDRTKAGLPALNPKRILRVMRENGLTLRKPVCTTGFSRKHDGRVSVDTPDTRWCSDGLEFKCLNGETVTATFVLDCCDRECLSLVARSGKGLTSSMVCDALVNAVDRRFAGSDVQKSIQFLSDNGAAYISKATVDLVRLLGFENCKTAVCSPQSNGMAEAFVRILKRDYLLTLDLSSAKSAMADLAKVQNTYNEEHPHSALGMLSPVEYRTARGYSTSPATEIRLHQELAPIPPEALRLIRRAQTSFSTFTNLV